MHFLPFRLRVVPRVLQFKQPAGTSRGVYLTRRVWYIVLTSADAQVRFTGLGECAPLPDLSADYSDDYEARLRALCQQVEQEQGFDAEALRHVPSMLFGLQTAFRSAAGSLAGDYLRLYPSRFAQGLEGLRINGLVWMGNFEEMQRRMDEKLDAGFGCVKLKIGAIDFDSELALLRRLRGRYSAADVELRVDANGAFSPAEAPARLEALARFSLHSIEQPIKQGQWEEMAALCRTSPLPIALDEEMIGVHETAEKQRLLDTIRPHYLVLKPSLHGAFTGCAEWMALARERGIGYWVTSALESNVGLNAIAQWTAATAEAHATPDAPPLMPQGLGTGQLFVQNFDAAPLCIEGDRLWYGHAAQRAFAREAANFKARWCNPSPTLTLHTSGSTGEPKPFEAEKVRMWHSAETTLQALGLQQGNTALLCLPLQFVAGQMMLVRAMAGGLQTLLRTPSLHPYAGLHEAPDFAALTPAQVAETLRVPHERSLLRRTLCLIIGGGALPPAVEEAVRTFPHPIFSTYGMTETLSHIALRRLNGEQASHAYTPLPGVSVGTDAEGCLTIDAPAWHDGPLVTNDLAEVYADGSFKLHGRRDNTICSGGLKLQAEALERKLAGAPCQLLITATPHPTLGEAVTLLYAAPDECSEALTAFCQARLSRHEMPRAMVRCNALPLTATGKPARAEARRMATEALRRDE